MSKNTRFKIARIEAGLTQKQLSEMLEIGESVIVRIETGRQLPNSVLKTRLCEILNKQSFELFMD